MNQQNQVQIHKNYLKNVMQQYGFILSACLTGIMVIGIRYTRFDWLIRIVKNAFLIKMPRYLINQWTKAAF
jgi:hypothetical protein